MIVRFYNRCLEALDILFGFEGAISRVDRIDMSPPVLVVDISRMSQASMGFPCFLSVGGATAGVGATVDDAVGISANAFAGDALFQSNLSARSLTLDELDFWFLGVSCTITAGSANNLSSIEFAIEHRNNTVQPVFVQTFDLQTVTPGVGGRVMLSQDIRVARGNFRVPTKIEAGSRFLGYFTDDATGQIDANLLVHLWATPKGTFPPGS